MKEHTKNSYDQNFNTMKQLCHYQNAYIKSRALKILSESYLFAMKDSDEILFCNIEETQKKLYRKHPSSTINKSYLFIAHSNNPTSVTAKMSDTSDE